MHIRYGYTLELACASDTEIVTVLDVHPEQRGDITQPDEPRAVALADAGRTIDLGRVERDAHGNILRRILAPAGGIRMEASGVIFHSGFAETAPPGTPAVAAQALPEAAMPFLLASRCCPVDAMSEQAWSLFRHAPAGAERVLAICEYVRGKLLAISGDGPPALRPAAEALDEGMGSMADYAHCAIAFCRALEMPARYCAGHLPAASGFAGRCEGAFCAWFEVFLEGGWFVFDAWHAESPIGRVLVARGRDAADAPPVLAGADCGPVKLECFASEIAGARYPVTSQDRRERWQTRGAAGA